MTGARAVILPGGRLGTLTPADEAGEWYIRVEDDPAEHWLAIRMITERQCRALQYLRMLYGKGGGLVPGRRSYGHGGRSEVAQAAARAEERELVARAPTACRSALLTACQGEWPVCPGMPAVLRDGLDAVADGLRL
jgi:hypothetical protein